jgi:hypothetical protein
LTAVLNVLRHFSLSLIKTNAGKLTDNFKIICLSGRFLKKLWLSESRSTLASHSKYDDRQPAA